MLEILQTVKYNPGEFLLVWLLILIGLSIIIGRLKIFLLNPSVTFFIICGISLIITLAVFGAKKIKNNKKHNRILKKIEKLQNEKVKKVYPFPVA